MTLRPIAVLVGLLLSLSAAAQQSPYFRSHATNPVKWQPWSEAAFEKARKEEKPIFLSIGYASCHWCHVMERESFMNEAIAATLNKHFVPILVDREEHPEVDATYIAFLESMTGSAGWPANLVLTPTLEPIVGGSYMKPEALTRLLDVIAERWSTDRKALLDSSKQLVEMARALVATPAPGDLDPKVLESVAADIAAGYDPQRGGWGGAPKFPQALTISYLLRYAHRTGNVDAQKSALDTLRRLGDSALNDQLGGGFHRYAVDDAFRVPHFEKMLYDQALLSIAYTEGWQVSKDASLQRVARSTLDWVLRELRAPKTTAFASALDSDTGHEEGAYYLWSKGELRAILGDDAEAAFRHFGVSQEKDNILYIADPAVKVAREKLLAARAKRVAPLRDDKVLTSWNGLMISALAKAGAAFDEPRYLEAATGAARFVTTQLWSRESGSSVPRASSVPRSSSATVAAAAPASPEAPRNSEEPRGTEEPGRLHRRWIDGHAGIDALPEDYAFLIQGLLDLFETTHDVQWLELAVSLQEQQDKLYWDATANRYASGTSLPSTLRGVAAESELALPAPNSVAALNLLRLGELTDSAALRSRANAIFRTYAQSLNAQLPALSSALLFAFSTPKQIVIAGDPSKAETKALLRIVHERFVPNRVLVVAAGGKAQEQLARYMPIVKEMGPIGGKATAFICEHYVCKLPTTSPEKVARLLE
ncbi:MAG TPA: thioredoxin domain-containing protein [Thermoanaerobaculia bacterium]|jgi:hypothetical protein